MFGILGLYVSLPAASGLSGCFSVCLCFKTVCVRANVCGGGLTE